MAVSLQEIADELRRPTPEPGSDEARRWLMWANDADVLIQRRAERLGVDVGTIPVEDFDRVVRLAVAAYVRRPDDATQVTKAVDDASVTKTYKSGTGRVTILDEWWGDLGLLGSSDVYSIQMTGAPDVSFYPESWA